MMNLEPLQFNLRVPLDIPVVLPMTEFFLHINPSCSETGVARQASFRINSAGVSGEKLTLIN